jgi:hypothetical protein
MADDIECGPGQEFSFKFKVPHRFEGEHHIEVVWVGPIGADVDERERSNVRGTGKPLGEFMYEMKGEVIYGCRGGQYSPKVARLYYESGKSIPLDGELPYLHVITPEDYENE